MSLYFMLKKPKGCITAVRDARHKTVMDYFPEELKKEVFPIGRLDRDTVGLLLITNDGKLAYKLCLIVYSLYFLFYALLPLLDLEKYVYSAFYDSAPYVFTFTPFFILSIPISPFRILKGLPSDRVFIPYLI